MGSTFEPPSEDLISATSAKYPCREPQIRALTTLLHVRIRLPSQSVDRRECATAAKQQENAD